jgi:hypothetical protein
MVGGVVTFAYYFLIFLNEVIPLCINSIYSDTSANKDNSLAEIFVSRNMISRRFL